VKIPKKLTILGRTFVVKKIPAIKIKEAIGYDVDGAVMYSKKIIYLASELPPEALKLTLLHEVVHCIEITVGLNLVTEEKIREIWCESIASGFYDLMKQIK
jgi:Zn-dependent peptidase ImmA (M78 family)